MLYDMLATPPSPGSPVESLMIMVWQMRQDATYFLNRAIVQAAMEIGDGGEASQKSWGEFTDKFYPYLEDRRKKGDAAALKVFYKEFNKKLIVTPLASLSKRARRNRAGKSTNSKIVSRLWKRKNR